MLAKIISCHACRDGIEPPFAFSMAFQPIVDAARNAVVAYEALVRGPNGEPAAWVFAQVTEANLYAFDQCCRVRAIEIAARLGLPATGARLSINFLPRMVYSPVGCIGPTLEAADRVGFPVDRIIFEITEDERVCDFRHLLAVVVEYRRRGFQVALDDLGAGHAGLNLLADLPVDIVKLNMNLIRSLHNRYAAQSIVEAMAALSAKLGFALIAEGVETVEEYNQLRACGVHLMQGYLLARPAFEALPVAVLPGHDGHARIGPEEHPREAKA